MHFGFYDLLWLPLLVGGRGSSVSNNSITSTRHKIQNGGEKKKKNGAGFFLSPTCLQDFLFRVRLPNTKKVRILVLPSMLRSPSGLRAKKIKESAASGAVDLGRSLL